ncbi:MAG: hypothetical protein ACI4HO_06550 [Ruminococcus sp.]
MIYIYICLLAFFAVIGVCESLRGLVRIFTKSKDDREIILIEPICNKQEDAEYLLRSAAQKVKWMGKNGPDRVICLDCNMDEETKKLCEMVCRDYSFMELCSKDDMFEILDNACGLCR